MVTDMRVSLWAGKGWELTDVDSRMVYLGCMWGFDQDARISEYTPPGLGQQDHCVRLRDLEFEYEDETGARNSTSKNDSFTGLRRCADKVQGCWVRTSTHKTGTAVKQKFIGRRGIVEA